MIVCFNLTLLAVFFDPFQLRLGVFLGLEQLLEALRGLVDLLIRTFGRWRQVI
jgi:hypothetical protein